MPRDRCYAQHDAKNPVFRFPDLSCAGERLSGTNILAPSGAPVWNTATIDPDRNQLYVGTGENYSLPASDSSDAIIAMDLDNGEIN